MARFDATCIYVNDGDTFQTAKDEWIRLTNVCAPDSSEDGWAEAKNTLSNIILNKEIVYEPAGTSSYRTEAEVWVGEIYVNGYMRRKEYACP